MSSFWSTVPQRTASAGRSAWPSSSLWQLSAFHSLSRTTWPTCASCWWMTLCTSWRTILKLCALVMLSAGHC